MLPESRNLRKFPSTTAVALLVQEYLFKWQYIAFFRAYLDTILKALYLWKHSKNVSFENWLQSINII